MTAEVVPFGKYKGQPVEVLAADTDYCEWLTAQPWFKARYLNVYNTVINYGAEPQDSPEHNQMQARFLDDAWCFALADLLMPGREGTYDITAAEKLAARDKNFCKFRLRLDLEMSDADTITRFEDNGWDVTYVINPASIIAHLTSKPSCTCHCDHGRCDEDGRCRSGTGWCRHRSCYEEQWTDDRYVKTDRRLRHCCGDCPWNFARDWLERADKEGRFYQPAYDVKVHVELKPDLGDDYPSVLRQVTRYPQGSYGDKRCVIARRHAFQSVTWEQVQKIFAASGIKLLAESEVGA